METVFEKIILKKISADIIYENDCVLVIKDIAPQAPIHYLILPKKKYVNVSDIPHDELGIMQEMFRVAQILASRDGGVPRSYKLIINNGANAGQVVFYLHMHFLSWDC
jgi:histidine triad (HIT) family protein